MFGDPLGGLLFGGETLDYFRLAIGPKNIDHPAKSGITFRATKAGRYSDISRICAYGAPVQAGFVTDRNLRSTALGDRAKAAREGLAITDAALFRVDRPWI